MSQYDLMLDFKIKVGQNDLYFMSVPIFFAII